MELPLDEDRIRSIVAHVAHLRAEYGDAFAAPELVEPNGTYFPDAFALTPESIAELLERMRAYVPISDEVTLGLAFVEEDQEQQAGGGCGTGACAPGGTKALARGGAMETEEGYAAILHVADVGEPAILTTSLARSLGRIVLFEADEEVDPRDDGPLAELTAITAGLGVLILNGACVYKKACSGMRRHQATFLGLEEISFALALFVRTTAGKAGAVRKHLEVTQKEAFDLALAWVDTQPTLVKNLVDAPATLTDGVFSFEAKKGIFSRLFGGSPKKDAGPEMIAPSSRRVRSEQELQRLAEAKALVDDAFAE